MVLGGNDLISNPKLLCYVFADGGSLLSPNDLHQLPENGNGTFKLPITDRRFQVGSECDCSAIPCR